MKSEKKYKKIYIICTSNNISGGPETLHQLANKINEDKLGEAIIVYYGKQKQIPDKFSKYNVKVAKKIEDSEDNLLIVPEVLTYYMYRYKKINKCIWWLSLDNYYRSLLKNRVKIFKEKNPKCKFLAPLAYLYSLIIERRGKSFTFGKDKNEIFHMYNCEYAKQYLISQGVKEECTQYLCGPIRKEYFKNNEMDKKNIVVYNPKKGLKYTEKIINYFKEKENKDIEFVPIENMTAEQVHNLLKTAKLYMDFGHFPGPERIPREAVVSNCCIITSKLGSAANLIDVPIPAQYKYDTEMLDLDSIYEKIIDIMNNYEKYLNDFDIYREKVKEQIVLFDRNIEHIFKK